MRIRVLSLVSERWGKALGDAVPMYLSAMLCGVFGNRKSRSSIWSRRSSRFDPFVPFPRRSDLGRLELALSDESAPQGPRGKRRLIIRHVLSF